MPYIYVTSNVAAKSVSVDTTVKELSKTAAKVLGKPESYVMAQLDLDKNLIFGGSSEPCAIVAVKNIGRIDTGKTAAAVTEVVSKQLNVDPSRIYVGMEELKGSHFAMAGNTFG